MVKMILWLVDQIGSIRLPNSASAFADDDLCQIHDEDDLMVGGSNRSNSASASADLNKKNTYTDEEERRSKGDETQIDHTDKRAKARTRELDTKKVAIGRNREKRRQGENKRYIRDVTTGKASSPDRELAGDRRRTVIRPPQVLLEGTKKTVSELAGDRRRTVIRPPQVLLEGTKKTVSELAGDRRRTVIRPPLVLREGTNKTFFVNFMDLCKKMHRQPDHVMAFLLAELGTSGSLDGQQRLVVKGIFAPKKIERILRGYINEYVSCLGCKSPDTILSKENRLFFLRCEKCGSGRSVAPIKDGLVARVSRRNAWT
ncbi:eukaryotic translation initiation factor 2 subunit beta-like [Euphorbia lathyris]|uniref:eukaryotic translation initiation factor 2 subunit beta-like n=1 Tax=Euphorbia lathyris TaxID=212925 RepID=UPI003314363D